MNKLLLSYILIVGISAVAGAGAGVVLKRTLGPIDEVYPPGFSPDEYVEDIGALWDKYTKNPSQSFSNPDLVNISLEKYRRTENSYSLGIGTAHTIIEQTIRSAQIRNGNTYWEEQISYSNMVSVANRSKQFGKDGNVELYKGTASGPESASYPSSPTSSYTRKEYKDYLGKSLDEMFIYIISNKTALKSDKKTNSDGDYIISLDLETNISTYFYKYQMKNISGLSNLPPFSEVKLTYTISKDLVLKHLSVNETYTATKEGIPVPAKTNNTIEYYYFANEVMEIPNSDTAIDYSRVEKE